MNPRTERRLVAGPVGQIECAIDRPAEGGAGLALICHPHPLHGGTMDNKVVQTLARAALQCGWTAVRFNFRGIGASAGAWDQGRGEIDDALAVLAALRGPGQRLLLAGFSFGGFVASQVAARLAAEATEATDPALAAERVVLVAPAVVNFTTAPLPPGSAVIHGEADDVVPLAAVLDWARPQAQPVAVLPGAGHFFHGQLPVLKQMVVAALAAPAAS